MKPTKVLATQIEHKAATMPGRLILIIALMVFVVGGGIWVASNLLARPTTPTTITVKFTTLQGLPTAAPLQQ